MKDRFSKIHSWIYWLSWIAIFAGITLTIVSWLELCSSSCTQAHDFRLFGQKFEVFGLIFFAAVSVFHLLTRWNPIYRFINGLLIASGIGAEFVFILIQKKVIGSYCPICLSIAGSLLLLAIFYTMDFFNHTYQIHKKINQEAVMDNIWKTISSVSMVFVGVLIAFVGITKVDPLEAKEESIKEQIAFGKKDSPIEAYLFTDWVCPACKKLESNIDQLVEEIAKKGSFVFVDYAIHSETMNFMPYNLSFEIHNKPKYFQLRDILKRLSDKTKSPTEEQVEKAIAPLGVSYKELNYSDVALATRYFNKLADQFKVQGTPTLVIINKETKKGKRLVGIEEITPIKAQKAIDKLKD
jgi:protein-disulfide isomerase/uncharacterized membrane protein